MPPKSTPRPKLPPPASKPEHRALAALKESRWLYVLVSLLLLAPCYWQQHVQAGDLSSHIYNAWLAQLIESRHPQGLQIAGQSTNILFDLMLGGLFRVFGPEAAQRISVSLSVLIFIWGAFALAGAVSGRKAWQILPCIAMLAYGWVFHMGFFNFYLSLGLCFWALALLWEPTLRRVAMAIPIFAVAYVAHALPVVWAAGLVAYAMVDGRLSDKARVYLMPGSMAAMLIFSSTMARTIPTSWSAGQIALSTGLDQFWVFDGKYFAILAGLLLMWSVMLLNLIHLSDARQVLFSLPFQLCAICGAAVFLLPTSIRFPGYRNALAFIAERMSLAVGICFCALLAGARPRRFERGATMAIAILFFAFLYRDERALNSFEDQMKDAVAGLPPGQRVVSAIIDPDLRINVLAHIVDRACIGHCYSYANYEPSTAQFRIRVDAPKPYVASSYEDSWLMQNGMYVVKESDLPLYQVDLEDSGEMKVKSLRAGVPSGRTTWNVLPSLL